MAVALQRRWLCGTATAAAVAEAARWPVKQVTKSNFAASAEEMRAHLSACDFVAVSLRRTGSSSAPWRRVTLPFDTADAAYSKAKLAAERFQLFQLALCPFSLKPPSSLLAHPYNYLLYPRDELKLGLPSYSFWCQSSNLASMAKEGFDFNSCIYDGISYLSRAQESAARTQMGHLRPGHVVADSVSAPTVADSVYLKRIRSRIMNWKNSCKKIKENEKDALLSSLGKILRLNEFYGDRPSTSIDVCSERQIQLVLQILSEFPDELVPLLVPAKSGGTQVVRVVFTGSKEDKELLETELHQLEERENKQVRGFREVIDLICASQKPVVSYNSLTDFTYIYSKFIGPLPPTVDEFASSLHEVFPNVIDVGHMMKVIGPSRKVTNIPLAISYLNNNFSAPVDVQIPHPATQNEAAVHGHNVVRICHLFAKLCTILKIDHSPTISGNKVILSPALEECTNIFNAVSTGSRRSINNVVSLWRKSTRKVRCEQLVFLWGFGSGMTAGKLKSSLNESHRVFSEEFDIRLVDKSCAVVVFWKPGLAEAFLDVMNDDYEITGSLKELASEGLRAASYETYKRACKSAIFGKDLGESLDKALEDEDQLADANPEATSKEIYWCSDSVIDFDDL